MATPTLCDVTLREGDQMPGRSYGIEQRVAAGRALDDLGVELIQAGFPVTGESDRETVRRLACDADVKARIVALARAVAGDVDAALTAEADVIEVMVPVSDLQLGHVLDESRETAFEMLVAAVERVRDGGATPHVTLVDAFRTEPSALIEAFERVPDVPTVSLADTVGARTPHTVHELLSALGASVDLSRAGVHFHDDLGVATANALAACDHGVGRIDVSVASLGERAGNAALEEVVVAGTTDLGVEFGVDTERVIPACTAVLDELDESVEPRKAVLGREVTEHESGIHTAAMVREPATFEPFAPADFGGGRRLLFGEGTGRGGARALLERAGVEPTDERVSGLLDALAERGPVDAEAAIDLAESRAE
ncbi:citramalate synthase [Halobacteriales archaeon QS_6_71_20]|nr:MAG: citramalate synthase [Halobacteriales archaeon QS_6_71_20]